MSDEEYEMMPLIGDAFPEIRMTTTQGKVNLPNDYAGKWFVLFSHPADFTPVCTTEFAGFAKRAPLLKELNCELIGLSLDQVFSHIKWVQWIEDNLGIEVPFPVIADNGRLAKKLGMLHPKRGSSTVRAVFVVDPKGIIRLILYYPPEIGRNLEEVVRIVKALQFSDTNKVAAPANWPENDLIGDKAIVPPPTTLEGARKRLKDKGLECMDWWFCYKKVE